MLEKIRYRLVYNRKKKLNKQREALVQVEASQYGRKAYFSTRVYLKSEILTLTTESSSDDISVAVGGESGLKAIIKAVKDGNRLVIRGSPDESSGFGEYITAFNADVQVSSYL